MKSNTAHLTLRPQPTRRTNGKWNSGYADECVDLGVSVDYIKENGRGTERRNLPMTGYGEDHLDIGDLFDFLLRDSTIILSCDSEGFRKILRLHHNPETGRFVAPEIIYEENRDADFRQYLIDGIGGSLSEVTEPKSATQRSLVVEEVTK